MRLIITSALNRTFLYECSNRTNPISIKLLKNSYFAEQNKSLVADEMYHELLRFTISTNVKKDVEQPYTNPSITL